MSIIFVNVDSFLGSLILRDDEFRDANFFKVTVYNVRSSTATGDQIHVDYTSFLYGVFTSLSKI